MKEGGKNGSSRRQREQQRRGLEERYWQPHLGEKKHTHGGKQKAKCARRPQLEMTSHGGKGGEDNAASLMDAVVVSSERLHSKVYFSTRRRRKVLHPLIWKESIYTSLEARIWS